MTHKLREHKKYCTFSRVNHGKLMSCKLKIVKYQQFHMLYPGIFL